MPSSPSNTGDRNPDHAKVIDPREMTSPDIFGKVMFSRKSSLQYLPVILTRTAFTNYKSRGNDSAKEPESLRCVCISHLACTLQGFLDRRTCVPSQGSTKDRSEKMSTCCERDWNTESCWTEPPQ